MIALITSTIHPPNEPIYGEMRSRFTPETRLAQTQRTVASLITAGITSIVIADNSVREFERDEIERLGRVRLLQYHQFPFKNKGISEAYLVLSAVRELPDEEQILKISGRYEIAGALDLGDNDLGVKFDEDQRGISTRAYMARNRVILEQFLRASLQEMFRFPFRIVGPRSFFRVLRNSVSAHDSYCYYDPTIGLETAAAEAIKRGDWRVKSFPHLGISGKLATSQDAIAE